MPTFHIQPESGPKNRRSLGNCCHKHPPAKYYRTWKRCDPKKERIIIYKLAVNVSSPSCSISNIVWLPPGMKPPATLGRPLPPNTMNLEVQTTTDEFRCVFCRLFVNARVCRFGVLQSFPEMEWRSGWWFQTFFIFNPTWGSIPIWLIFFKWVETTN